MPRPSPVVTVMINAARAAARSLTRDFGEVEFIQVSRKGPGDFVSVADHKAEEIIFEQLSKARPGYGFLMEERGFVEGTDKTNLFVVDPLDGTLNFLHSIPHFAVSIALRREGKLTAGVVMDVIRNEIFWAERGQGAWLEQRRLKVANRLKLADSVIATGTPWIGKSEEHHARFSREMAEITPRTAGVRRFGSAALDLAYVAAGRYDGFWERGLKAWDIAGGIVLVEEAGGKVHAIGGGEVELTGNLIASNPSLTPKLAGLIDRPAPETAE